MHKCKFPGHFIRIVMQCVSTVFVLNSGIWIAVTIVYSCVWFETRRSTISLSICPMYGSTIYQEIFNRQNLRGFFLVLKSAEERKPYISHLFFADDCNVYFNCELQACSNIKKIFGDYVAASGQVINFNESGILVSNNMPVTQATVIQDFFQCYKSALKSEFSRGSF